MKKKKQRILALLLAFVMVWSIMPVSAVTVSTADVPQAEDSVVDKQVTFLSSFPWMWRTPDNTSDQIQANSSVPSLTLPAVAVIKDVYQRAGGTLLYYVDAAEGYTWPSGLAEYHWIDSEKVSIIETPAPTDPIDPSEPTDPSEPPVEGPTISGEVKDADGNPVLDENGNPLVISVQGDLPEGAYVSATVPNVEGLGEIAGIFDIKVLVPDSAGNMVEWQPVDYGKTVAISIPVAGVEDGGFVNVYHFIDYAPALEGKDDLRYYEVAHFEPSFAVLLANSEAISSHEGFAPAQVTFKAEVKGKTVQIETDSFSIYHYDGTEYLLKDEQAIEIGAVSNDTNKYYFVTRGTKIIADKGALEDFFEFMVSFTWSSSEPSVLVKDESGTNVVYTVAENAEIYKMYDITVKARALGGLVDTTYTSTMIVMPELTLKFESNIPGHNLGIDSINGIFMGNAEEHNPEKNQFVALYYQLPTPTPPPGYKLSGEYQWYVSHEPSKTFTTGQEIPLSNTTLEVETDDGSDAYEVTLIANFVPEEYTITYNNQGEITPVAYATDDEIEIPLPSGPDGYIFNGWKVTSSASVQNWTQYSILPAGSTLHNMYGNVTLTADWVAADGIPYKVEHHFQNVSQNGYTVDAQVDTLYGYTGQNTVAETVKRIVPGFTFDRAETKTIAGDGSTVVAIYYMRNTVTISFNTNGGTPAVESITGVYGSLITAPDTTQLYRQNYVFGGWYSTDNPDANYQFLTMPAENLTLYARWNVKKTTVTFLDGSANGSVLYVINGEAGSALEWPADPTKPGYMFTGWDSAPFHVIPETDKTVIANWALITYEISFKEKNGSSERLVSEVSPNPQSFTILSTDSTGLPTPTRTGYIFDGWYADPDCTGNPYDAMSLAMELLAHNESATVQKSVYAKWTPMKYTISYALGLTPERLTNAERFTAQSKTHGVDIQLNSEIPTAIGATFAGWDSDGDGDADYAPGATYTVNGPVVLKAVWNPTPYKINYTTVGLAAGSTAHFNDQEGYYQDKFFVQSPAVTGYTIGKITVDGNEVAAGYEIVIIDSDVSVEITYVPIAYTIVFNGNGVGVTGSMTNMAMTYDVAKNLTANAFTRTGYTFAGWTTAADGSGALYTDGAEVKNLTNVAGNSVNLYAKWIPQTYTVRFAANDGTGTMADQTFTYNQEKALFLNAFTRTGYTFAGWKDANGNSYADGETVKNLTDVEDGVVVLTAQWTRNSYQVIYKIDGAEHVKETYGYGESVQIIPVPNEREGYTFSGWKNGDEAATDFTMPDHDVVITGDWTVNRYTLTWVVDNVTTVFTYDYGAAVAKQEDPAKKGYTFTGWDTEIPDTMPAHNVTITATWKANSYTIVFDGNGHTGGTMAPLVMTYDEEQNLTANAFTRTGYAFTGWSTKADGTGATYADNASVENLTDVANGTVTLYAQWKVQYSYKLVFAANTADTVNGMPGAQTKTWCDDASWTFSWTETPTRTNYKFLGWSTDPNATSGTLDKQYTVTGKAAEKVSVTLYAIWELDVANYKTQIYVMDINGVYVPESESTASATIGSTVSVTPETREGFTVDTEESKLSATVAADGSTTLKIYYARNSYTLAWVVDNVRSEHTYMYGAPVDRQKDPSKNGYTFTGWDQEIPATMPAHDVTITAKWEIVTYTVTFNANGGTVTPGSKEYTIEAPVELPVPTRDGYQFTGWKVTNADGNWTADAIHEGTVAKGKYGHVILTAQWTANTNTQYTVETYMQNLDGSYTTTTETKYGTTDTLAVATVNAPEGFKLNSGKSVASGNIAGDGSLVLQVYYDREAYTVTWNVDGKESKESYLYGEKIKKPENPTKQGYSFTGWTGYTDDMTMPAGDRTFTATWTPRTDTAYIVYHYVQNVAGSDYELRDQENLTGTTDSTVTPAVKNYEGFTAPATQTVIVKGDGTTTVKYYYTRNSYTITWMNGGAEYHKSTYRYGENITRPADPEKQGYTFKGWNGLNDATMPARSFTVEAVWEANEMTVVVKHYLQTADGSDYVPDGHDELSGRTDETITPPVRTYTGFVSPATKTVIVKGDGTTTVKYYYNRIQYTVTYVADGQTVHTEQVRYQADVQYVPAVPTKVGYTQTAPTWNHNGRNITQDTVITAQYTINTYTITATMENGVIAGKAESYKHFDKANVTFTPNVGYKIIGVTVNGVEVDEFTENSYVYSNASMSENVNIVVTTQPKTYTIRFENHDGTLLQSIVVPHGKMPVYSGATPTKESTDQFSYTFAGWTPVLVEATVDTTYTATFNASTRAYTITWVDGDGRVIDTDILAYGTTPAYTGVTPTKSATAQYTYTFNYSWSPAIETVTGDAVYTAQFEATVNKYTVTWVNKDGSQLEVDNNVPYGETPSYDGATPTKVADKQFTYTFAGWDPEIESVTGDVTYTATYTATVNKYTITWIVDGNTTQEVYEYGQVPSFKGSTDKAADAQYTYTFDGWNPTVEKVTGDATYTALYTTTLNTYTVTWKNEDGTVLETDENVPYGTVLRTESYNGTAPQKPSDAEWHYIFAGWNPSVIDGYTVTGDITITAQYNKVKQKYTIRWLNKDGTELEIDENVEYGTTPTYNGATPTWEPDTEDGYRYTFKQWSPVVSPVTGEATYRAEYEQIPIEYTISYSGTEAGENPTVYTVKSDTITLINPTKTGYTFAGWTGTGLTEATMTVTIPAGSIGNREYTANWTVIEYSISYTLNGGAVDGENPVKYTVEDAVTLINPTREGYTFIGWTGTDLDGMTLTVTISKGSIGDRSYTANWKANEYEIVFDANGGSGDMDALVMTYDTAKKLTANGFTRTGYHFIGWNTEADGAGTAYADQVEVNNLVTAPGGSITLYAQWEINTISLTITTNNPIDHNQTYIFTVQGKAMDGSTVELTVALGANDQQKIVELPAGEYTISDQAGWSWRYKGQSLTQNVLADTVVDFNYNYTQKTQVYWLNGYGNELLKDDPTRRKK